MKIASKELQNFRVLTAEMQELISNLNDENDWSSEDNIQTAREITNETLERLVLTIQDYLEARKENVGNVYVEREEI